MKSIVGDQSSNTITTARNHGFRAGEEVEFIRLLGGAGLTGRGLGVSSRPTRYFVIASGLTDKVFKVATTVGGAAVNYTTDITGGYVRRKVRAPGDA